MEEESEAEGGREVVRLGGSPESSSGPPRHSRLPFLPLQEVGVSPTHRHLDFTILSYLI